MGFVVVPYKSSQLCLYRDSGHDFAESVVCVNVAIVEEVICIAKGIILYLGEVIFNLLLSPVLKIERRAGVSK